MKPATCPFLDRERLVAQILRWVFLSLAAAGVVRCVMSPIAIDRLCRRACPERAGAGADQFAGIE